jgi:hypothetical protein
MGEIRQDRPRHSYEAELDAVLIDAEPRLAHRFVSYLPYGYARRQLDMGPGPGAASDDDPLLTMFIRDIDESVTAEGINLDAIRTHQEHIKQSESVYERLVRGTLPVIRRLRTMGYKLSELQDWDSKPGEIEKTMTRDEIIGAVKELRLPKGKYVVYGSGPLAAAEIREARGVDLLVTTKLRNRLHFEGWKKVKRSEQDELDTQDKPVTYDVFEATDNWDAGPYSPTLEQLLNTAMYVDGVPFASLEEVRNWKVASGGAKHIADVRMIDWYTGRDNQNRRD